MGSSFLKWLRKHKVDCSKPIVWINGQIYDLNSEKDLMAIERVFVFDESYFRLWCNQAGRHMATGYNDKGIEALKASYIAYVSNDTDESDIDLLKGYTPEYFIAHLESAGFTVEKSFTIFNDEIENYG